MLGRLGWTVGPRDRERGRGRVDRVAFGMWPWPEAQQLIPLVVLQEETLARTGARGGSGLSVVVFPTVSSQPLGSESRAL